MCGTCGCGEQMQIEHGHADHRADRHAGHPEHEARTVVLEERVLDHNDRLAAAIRTRLAEQDVVAVNLMSSPGSGKTTLLERTVRELRDGRPILVLEGDQETAIDADG